MPINHVAVIGAGIVGAAVARAAVAAGAAVTLVEAATPGGGTSGTSLAWLNANAKLPREYHDFSVRAMVAWRRLALEFGNPDWYRPVGNLTWAVDDARRAALTETVARLRDWGYAVTEPDASAVRAMDPALRLPADAQVAYFPDEGYVEPEAAINALLAQARAELVPGRATLDGDGLRLDDGRRVQADAYICCAGAQTPQLLKHIPLVDPASPGSAAPGLVAHLHLDGSPLHRVVHAPDLSIRPAPNGLRMDAPDVDARVHAHDNDQLAGELRDRAHALLAGVPADAPVRGRLCIRPLPLDGKPIVGWVPGTPKTYVVVAHSGVTLAPLLAELTVREVLAGEDEPDLAPYRPGRFV